MKTPIERGRYGRWLVARREALGYATASAARTAMSAVGINIAHSTYAEYESGSKVPSRNHLPLLERFYGTLADYEAQAGTVPTDVMGTEAVVAAIDRQTRVLAVILSRLGGLTPADMDLVQAALNAPLSERLPAEVA